MPRVIHGGSIGPLGTPQAAWVVEYKRKWADTWITSTNLEPLHAEAHAWSVGGSMATLLGRYGPAVKQPGENAFHSVTAPDFSAVVGWWVKISLFMNGTGLRTIFVGRVLREAGCPQGSAYGAQGDKLYFCYGAEQILRSNDFYQSWWERGGAPQLIGWLPGFNVREDRRGGEDAEKKRGLGNKSALRDSLAALFGGTQDWSHFDALEMILKRYVNRPVGDGPIWTIGGQVQYLKDLTAEIELDDVENVGDLIDRIVATRWGLDLTINYVSTAGSEGFELTVFALLGESTAYGGFSYPLNTRKVSLSVSTDYSIADCQIERDATALADRIVVVGAQVISCFTLSKQAAGFGYEQFDRKWTQADEDAYKLGKSTTGSAAENDGVRAEDRFRDVWQAFGAIDSFGWQNMEAVPMIDPNGVYLPGQHPTYFQTQIRRTLSWIPLKENGNYSTDPPGAPPASQVDAEFRPPMAIAKLLVKNSNNQSVSAFCYVDKMGVLLSGTADGISASVRPLEHDWGLRLEAGPNHVFGQGNAPTIGPTKANKSKVDAADGVIWNDLILTIAAPCDYRLVMYQDLPPEIQSGQGLVKCVHAPQLQFWYLAPGTVWGYTSQNVLLRSPAAGTVLRNDAPHGARIMAGAIARFLRERIRASISFSGLVNWNTQIGAILETVEDDEVLNIGSPISSVVWDFKRRTTTIGSGQAIGTGSARQRQAVASRRPRGQRSNVTLPGELAPRRGKVKGER